jgi:hypothetical protein
MSDIKGKNKHIRGRRKEERKKGRKFEKDRKMESPRKGGKEV